MVAILRVFLVIHPIIHQVKSLYPFSCARFRAALTTRASGATLDTPKGAVFMPRGSLPVFAVFRHIRSSSYLRRVFFYISAAVSAIIIVSAAASYLVMRAQMVRANDDRVRQELKQAAASFSTMFASSILPAAEQVYETPAVNRLIYGSSLTGKDLLDAAQLLDRFKLANPLIDSIEVYNHPLSLIYSTRSGLASSSLEQFSGLVSIFRNIRRYGLFRIIPRRINENNILTVILGSPPFTGTELLGALVINVREHAVRAQMLGRFETEQSELSIVDNSGIVLSGPVPSQFGGKAASDPVISRIFAVGAKAVPRADDRVRSFISTRAGGTVYVSYYREPVGGWTFVSITTGEHLLAVIAGWRNQIIAIFGLVLILSLFLALRTTRSVSLPIERLMSQTKVLQTELADLSPSTTAGDEFEMVAETMQQLDTRLRSLERSIALGAGYEERRSLARLLRGQKMTEEELEKISSGLSGTEDSRFIVAAFVLDGLEHLVDEGRVADIDSAMKILGTSIHPHGVRMLHADVQKGTLGVVIVWDTDPDEKTLSALEEGMRKSALSAAAAASAERSRSPLSFTIGLSDPVRSVQELPSAFDSAAEAVHYRFRNGSGAVIRFSQVSKEGLVYVLPEDELRRFAEHARLLDRVLVVSIVDALLADVQAYAFEDFLFLAQNILYSLERVFIESAVMSRRSVAEFRSRILNIRWIETGEDVVRFVAFWYERFCALAADGYARKLAVLIADLKRFIDDNLYDPELSTKTIASRMKLSVNYLRSMFKAATGESISTHITRLRIERCKELLSTTDMPVKEVYVAAGFSNYNYFFTLFKKQTGHTPQEYQRQIATN